MTNQTPLPGNALALSGYLSQMQADAQQLQRLLEALNSIATDLRREDLTLSVIEGAIQIARDLNAALDDVSIGKHMARAEE